MGWNSISKPGGSFLGRCWGCSTCFIWFWGEGLKGSVERVLLYYNDKAIAPMLVRPVQNGFVSFGAFLLGRYLTWMSKTLNLLPVMDRK